MSSKEQVYEYLESITKEFEFEHYTSYTTLNICSELNMSRSLVSLYLNEFVKEETVIKISSRPVYYLNRTAMERKFHILLSQNEYYSVQELFAEINNNCSEEKDFEKAIGCEGSLDYCVSQIKSALVYPGGLPILLRGEEGSGKSFLMKLIQEYCVNNNLLQNPQKSKRIKLNQIRIAEQSKKLKELLAELDGGILYLENISACSELAQEKLAEYISGIVGKQGKVRLVMSTDEKTDSSIYRKLLVNIPVICDIPSWIERNEDERKAFVVKFFKDEQERIGKTLYLSEKLIYILMNYQYEHNITGLKQNITKICANAYSQKSEGESLEIYMYNLPTLIQRDLDITEKESLLLRLDAIQLDSAADNILKMWENVLEDYKQSENKKLGVDEFLKLGKKTLNYYYDVLIFKESYFDERLKPLEKLVAEMITNIRNKYNISFPINGAYVIARMLIAQQNHNSRLRVWENNNAKEIYKIYSMLTENMTAINSLTELLAKQIQANINIKLSQMNKVFIMLNLHTYNYKIKLQDTTGVILCHGYATASSIADTVNSLLQVQLFEAIDMPLSSSVDDVTQQLIIFIKDNLFYKNIILLVDTGSLENLGKNIEGSINLGIINNVSTVLALSVGEKILRGEKMPDIVEKACQENQCKYSIIKRIEKEKAIVFAVDAGRTVAEKLSRLFRESLPKSIPIEMIAYEYEDLCKNGCKDILFEKYEVELLVKTQGLRISNVKSVTLEEIMNFNDINVVDGVLSTYLSNEEIENFNQTLLKNFSLQSVLENLTILNAQKLLDYVSDATTRLQQILKRKFLSKTVIGINMHICFLIERLVTKTQIENYKNIDGFAKENQEFIRAVNESFHTLLSHYNVEIPLSEVAYLYEYIKNDIEVEGNENSF